MSWRIVPIGEHHEYSEEIKQFAHEAALKAALELRTEFVDCDIDSLKRLGHKWEARFLSAYGSLLKRFGDNVDPLLVLSDRMDIYTTQYEACLRSRAMELSGDVDKPVDGKSPTFDKFESKFSCGLLLAKHYNSACTKELLHDMPADSFPGTGVILEAISVNKLMNAALCINDSLQKSLDLLADSVSALHLSTQGEMQLESYFARKNDRKVIARKAAYARLENDPKQIALKNIEEEFRNSNYPFHKRGYTTKFVKEMAEKYTDIKDSKSIENLVGRLKKKYPTS